MGTEKGHKATRSQGHKVKNKRILITAGPTWVPIDSVRVISNIATGATGILLAEQLHNLGARVSLMLGPVQDCCLNKKIRLIRFKSFDELKDSISRELSSKRYDIVIHSAAVSDYRPKIYYGRKISSGMKRLRLDLVPTAKIIDRVKKIDPSVYLVGFKFEPQAAKDYLIPKAWALMKKTGADLVVANTIKSGRYSAFIVGKNKVTGIMRTRSELSQGLIRAIQAGIASKDSFNY